MQLLFEIVITFIVVVVRSPDNIQPLLAVVPVAYMLDNFVRDDSFVDDSRRARLDSWQHRVERMAVVALDIVANKCFDLVAVQALASLGVVN